MIVNNQRIEIKPKNKVVHTLTSENAYPTLPELHTLTVKNFAKCDVF